MEYRNLGRSGLQVSVVGLGCNNFGMRADYEATEAVVRACLDTGINLFDTADIYGGAKSEEYLGKALGANRQDVIVASKFAVQMGEGPLMRGASRRYIMQAVEASLRRLDTDYLDLYQVHFPDPETPLEETLRALDDLVRSGKVRYIGNSNFAGWEIASGHWIAEHRNLTPFVSAQNEYSLLKRDIETEVLPACEAFGLGMLPFFPLASGLLTGKYRRGEDAPEGARVRRALLRARHVRPQLGHRRAPAQLGRGARPQPAGDRLRLAARQALGLQRDRGRDEAGADRGERGRRRGAVERRRGRRARRTGRRVTRLARRALATMTERRTDGEPGERPRPQCAPDGAERTRR